MGVAAYSQLSTVHSDVLPGLASRWLMGPNAWYGSVERKQIQTLAVILVITTIKKLLWLSLSENHS